jgi:hypothetical protein
MVILIAAKLGQSVVVADFAIVGKSIQSDTLYPAISSYYSEEFSVNKTRDM